VKSDQEAWQTVLDNQGLARVVVKQITRLFFNQDHNNMLDATYFYKRDRQKRAGNYDSSGREYEGFVSWGDIYHEALIQLWRCSRTYDPELAKLSTFYFASIPNVRRILTHQIPLVAPPYSTVNFADEANIAWRSRWWVSLFSVSSEKQVTLEQTIADEKQVDDLANELSKQDKLAQADRLARYLYQTMRLPRSILIFLEYTLSGKTLESIGDKYELTRERVRQLLDPARQRLRALAERETRGERFEPAWNPTPGRLFAWIALVDPKEYKMHRDSSSIIHTIQSTAGKRFTIKDVVALSRARYSLVHATIRSMIDKQEVLKAWRRGRGRHRRVQYYRFIGRAEA